MSFLKADVDSAHVKFPPPLIALLSILFGTLLNWFWPAPSFGELEMALGCTSYSRGSRHHGFLFPALQKGSNKYRTIEDNIP